MATPPIRPPANQNQLNATILQKQSADATKKGFITASNRPEDRLRADVLANDPTQNSGVASLENFKSRNGSRTKPLVMRYPQEIGSPKSDIPHVMQFKIYWRWEDTNLKTAGQKLKAESEATLKGMRDNLADANLKEISGFAAHDAFLNKTSDSLNSSFGNPANAGPLNYSPVGGPSTIFKAMNPMGTMVAGGFKDQAASANNNAAERANSRKTMEANIGNQQKTIDSISSHMPGEKEKFGATDLSKDSTVLNNRLNKNVASGSMGSMANKVIPEALKQKDPSYDQMVSVYLPFCTRINGDDAFSYDEADMAKSTGFVSGTNSLLNGDIKSLASQVGLGAFLAQGGAVGNVTSALSGMVLNPRIEKLFKQKDIRNFAFSWDFYPRNQDEVNMIKDIIETFRYHASPSKYSGTGNELDPQIVLRVPAEFTVKFISSTTNGFSENEHIPKISRCVITGIGVDYAPTGVFTTLPDNSPVAYTLTLSFSEMAQLTREDIGEGY